MEPRRAEQGRSRQAAHRRAAPAPGGPLGEREGLSGPCRLSPEILEALGPIPETWEMLRAVPAAPVQLGLREGRPEVT